MVDNSLKSFEDLQCWQACREVRNFITELVKSYPKEEQYSIVDNMKIAARSTTQIIAEGFGRFHYKENIQFCRQSRGSLFELIDDFNECFDEGYINEGIRNNYKKEAYELLKILNAYIASIKKTNSMT